MKDNNDPIIFLPLKSRTGVLVRYVKDRENICITVDQARYVYKKIEPESIH